jgi:hypothetical protein
MFKEALMKELRRIIAQVPWEERVSLATERCQQLVDEICPSDEDALLTPGQFGRLRDLVVPVVASSAPEGLYHARLDLERFAAAAIKRVCSGKVVPDPSDSRLSFISRAKALLAEIRRPTSRA